MNDTEFKLLVRNKDAVAKIKDQTFFLDNIYKTVPLRQRLWHIHNYTTSPPRCQGCNATFVKWNQKSSEYRRFCSSKCMANHASVREKTEATNVIRYGVKSTLQDPTVVDKIAKTNLQRYGVDNPFKSDEIQARVKQTNLQRYGTENPSCNTMVQAKITDTHTARYGRKRQSQSHIPMGVLATKNDTELMEKWFFEEKKSISEIANILGVNHSQLCVHFRDNLKFDVTRHRVSSIEREISDFLSSFNIQHRTSVRDIISPLEIDIIIDSINLGIEVDGLAWHSERRKPNKQYHSNKQQLMHAQGYQLIHVTDYEWKVKPDLVKSRLAAKIGFINQRLFARNCTVREVTAGQCKEFLDANHLQGSCVAGVRYGLYYDTNLVAVMTFGAPRFTKGYQYELLRYATTKGTTVVGGASKLFAHFVRTHPTVKSIVSYSDNRWNTGSLYEKLGFAQLRRTGPNYWYTRAYQTFESRTKYQKKKLSRILDTFDPEKSEWENMQDNGYDRYWDCGNTVWEWIKGT